MEKSDRDDLWKDGGFSSEGATEFSSIPRTALYEYMNRGLLAFKKVGRRRVISRRSLIELLEKGVPVVN